jgi:cytochrome c biogenesis protein CcdA
MVGSVLPALVSLAIIDSINPASITGALYLGGSGRKARLGLFIPAVYCTYLLFGLALTLGPAAALRSALAHSPIMIGPVLDVVVGVGLFGGGVRIWGRRAASPALAAPARTFGAGSALSLGALTTLADLPSAGPLLVASALITAANAALWTKVSDLLLYDVIYIVPLLAVAGASASDARCGRDETTCVSRRIRLGSGRDRRAVRSGRDRHRSSGSRDAHLSPRRGTGDKTVTKSTERGPFGTANGAYACPRESRRSGQSIRRIGDRAR